MVTIQFINRDAEIFLWDLSQKLKYKGISELASKMILFVKENQESFKEWEKTPAMFRDYTWKECRTDSTTPPEILDTSGKKLLRKIMKSIIERDNFKCQWQNCNLPSKKATLHVHHIFPVSQYPEYRFVKEYMITYCIYHHKKWHKARGDKYAEIIMGRKN